MVNFHFDKTNTFCINLKRREDRWKRMSSIFEKVGLDVTQWIATEPHQVTDPIYGTPTQRACAQSHLNVWKEIVKNNIPYALVMEDDISFDKEWKTKLETITDENFDLIMLNTDHFYEPVHSWTHTRGESYLTGAYIVSLKAAQGLVKSPLLLPSDHMLLLLQRTTNNEHCYNYFPYLAIQSSMDSDIEGSIPFFSYTNMIKQLDTIHYKLENYITE